MMRLTQILARVICSGAWCIAVFCFDASAAIFTVTNLGNEGAGSLRQAVADANASASDDVIVFDQSVFSQPQTIGVSTGGAFVVNNNGSLIVSGAGVSMPTVSGNAFQIFRLNGAANLTITNLRLTGGGSFGGNCGGAVENTSGTVTLNRVVISGNRASTIGGGICHRGGTMTINDSLIADNQTQSGVSGAQVGGGGIYNNGILIVNRSLFVNNSSTVFFNTGGAIHNNAGTATIINSTFSGNSATSGGGGAIGNRTGTVNIINSTIAANPTGVRNETGTINARNTIFANNNNGAGDFSGTLVSQGYNLIGNSTGATITGTTTGNLLNVAAQLAPLADNGGATQTFALQPNSPAINAGNNQLAADANGNPLRFDQRGECFRRFVGTAIDIGAFEVQTAASAVCSTLFDFDGDRRGDYAVFRPSNNFWYLQQSSLNFDYRRFGLSGDKLAPADYDGDGKTDLAVFRPSTRIWYLLNSSTETVTAIEFGLSNDTPVSADYDGDGRADIAVFRGGFWYIRQSSDAQIRAVQFGLTTDRPVAADYDGDGRTDVAVYREGVWYWLRSFDNNTGAVQFGIASDKAIPADYDGDGRADQAVYRDGVWYLLRSTLGFAGVSFGIASDRTVPADYDGDGKTDIAVWRSASGTFYVLRSADNSFAGFQFGADGDVPVAAIYAQ